MDADYIEIDEHDEIDPIDECGIGQDGICMLAGTEHCDFDCPYRDGGHPFCKQGGGQ